TVLLRQPKPASMRSVRPSAPAEVVASESGVFAAWEEEPCSFTEGIREKDGVKPSSQLEN
ncbi:unnamed protein product, partial [Musa hybrid cultivar]